MKTLDSLIIINISLLLYYEIKPIGRYNLTNFGNLLILIEDKESKIVSSLI